MSFLIEPDDPRIAWQGAVSLRRADGWVMPWRIPYEQRRLFPPEGLHERAAMAAGVRIAFNSDTGVVAGEVVPQAKAGAALDLYCDGKIHGTVSLAARGSFRFDGLSGGEKLIELWLPHAAQFRLRSLELEDGASMSRYEDPRPRWTTYGSSITHCRNDGTPSMTWPAIVAREHGLNLTCLGYGGQCHLEPMLARLIRDTPADFISMKVGINIYNLASLGPRTFRAAIIGFVQIIREEHPGTPLVLASPVVSPSRELLDNEVGFSLSAMREEVAAAFTDLESQGDRNIYYVDGLKLFGPDLVELMPDGLHPDADGYKALARNFLGEVAEKVFVKPL